MHADRRANARTSLDLPVLLEGAGSARMRDISADGLYLVLDSARQLDDWLSFEFAVPSTGLAFKAVAQVVRTEQLAGGGTGIAVRLHQTRLVALN